MQPILVPICSWFYSHYVAPTLPTWTGQASICILLRAQIPHLLLL